jgi:hypothetical protein
LEATTGTGGTYEISGVPIGDGYTIRLSKDDGSPTELPLSFNVIDANVTGIDGMIGVSAPDDH